MSLFDRITVLFIAFLALLAVGAIVAWIELSLVNVSITA